MTTDLIPVQEWEGYVESIGRTAFTGRLLDVTANAETEDEVARIPLSLLSKEDRAVIEPGVFFRWIIGHAPGAAPETLKSHVFLCRWCDT